MNHYTKEMSIRLIKKELGIRKHILSIIPDIKETIMKFDGKKITKRIDTALKKVDKDLCMKHDGWFFEIQYYDHSEPIMEGGHTYSIHNREINLYMKTCNGTVNAKQVCSVLDKWVEYYQKSVQETEQQLANLDNLIESYNKAREEYNSVVEEIPYLVKDYVWDFKDARIVY